MGNYYTVHVFLLLLLLLFFFLFLFCFVLVFCLFVLFFFLFLCSNGWTNFAKPQNEGFVVMTLYEYKAICCGHDSL